jgi:hypothetical protein
MRTKFYFLLFFAFLNCQCEKDSKKDNNLIDLAFGNAIDKIGQISTDWQQTVKDLEKEIKNDVSDIIQNDLTNFTQSTIASIGVEYKCDLNFTKDFAAKEMRKLRNRWRSTVLLPPLAIPIRAKVCSPVPSVINQSVTEVTFFGYDMIKGQIRLFLEFKNNTREDITDKYLSNLSEFRCNVIIGGSGLKPLPEHKRIVLECSTCASTFLSEVPINIPPIKKMATLAYGGGGGAFFDDIINADSIKRVSAIRISAGKALDLVQVQYEYFSGKKFWQEPRGSISNPIQEFKMQDGEFWKGVIIRHGSRIDEIQIITNKNTFGPFGGKGGAEVKLEDLGQIIGISGRAKSAIDALIFHYRK